MLARFAFGSESFLERLKKDFMHKFDADKNGYLDQKEMIRFLAYHVRCFFPHPGWQYHPRHPERRIALFRAISDVWHHGR